MATSRPKRRTSPAPGSNQQTLQIHGVADNYITLNGTTEVASLYSSTTASTPYPAVVVRTTGSGRAAAFTYDLARSVAYTRQGNPATAGTDHDHDGVVRTIDGFEGWVNLDRITLPQADEQQRLLRNLITYFGSQTVPIPQFWYFPQASQKSMLVITSDDHGEQTSRFQQMASIVEQYGGHETFYLSRYGFLSQSALNTLRSRGHEFSIHPYGSQDGQTLDQGYTAAIDWFVNDGANNAGGYGQPSSTVRTHQVEWQGWADAASVQASHGIKLNVDYYFWGDWLQKTNGDWVCSGYANGSGQPMKSVNQNGTIIPSTSWEPSWLTSTWRRLRLLWLHRAGSHHRVTRPHRPEPRAGDYAVVTAQAHTDYGLFTWLDGLASYAKQKGVPIWTAQRWLDFTQARQEATTDQSNWNPSTSH